MYTSTTLNTHISLRVWYWEEYNKERGGSEPKKKGKLGEGVRAVSTPYTSSWQGGISFAHTQRHQLVILFHDIQLLPPFKGRIWGRVRCVVEWILNIFTPPKYLSTPTPRPYLLLSRINKGAFAERSTFRQGERSVWTLQK